tara:strand:- start:177 stop:575 length:399 start_codon:yes stop_codon:yes gene_type:complete
VAKLSQGYEISLATAQLPQKLFEKYKKFIDSTIDTHDIPESVLDACNSRIRQIHGLEAANNEDNKDSTSTEKALAFAALKVAEKIVSSVHDIQDSDLLSLREALGASGVVQLITALAFFDVECRLELASRVF